MAGSYNDSPTFNDKNADVIFLSSDEPTPTRFHIHSMNLIVSTGAFPPVRESSEPASSLDGAIGLTSDEPVKLSETAAALEVLFAFMYPRNHPELEKIPFEELAAIAEAVEKYQVYPAITTCKTRMKSFLKTQPIGVGTWAARHGHTLILDKVAPWMMSLPLMKTLEMLPSHLILTWVEYYTHWEKVKSALMYYRDPDDNDHQNIRPKPSEAGSCGDGWAKISFIVIERYRQRLAMHQNPFIDFDGLFALGSSVAEDCCVTSGLMGWRKSVKEAIDNIPKFSELLARRQS